MQGPADIKNEMVIITAPDDHFNLWKEFITKHSTGELIDPETCERFNQKKGFKGGKSFQLQRSFFRGMGFMTEEETRSLVTHLLMLTKNWQYKYPKVSVHKTRGTVLPHHYSSGDWMAKKKRKRICIQELHDIMPSLGLCNKDMTINREKWHEWKDEHGISSATLNVLLDRPDKGFYGFRAEKKGMFKRSRDLTDKWPNVFPFFKKFLEVKGNFVAPKGRIRTRLFNAVKMEFGQQWRYDSEPRLGLALLDLRDTPGHSTKDDTVENPFFKPFMKKLLLLKSPAVSDPEVWVWISASQHRNAQAIAYGEKYMKQYEVIPSRYIPAKNERLNDHTTRNSGKDELYLVFLVRAGRSDDRKKVKSVYKAPNTNYYTVYGLYKEAHLRLNARELRMEFYIELLKTFCLPGENFWGVFSGTKCMLAARVSSIYFILLMSKFCHS